MRIPRRTLWQEIRDQVICDAAARGWPVRKIAAALLCSESTVRRVLKRGGVR